MGLNVRFMTPTSNFMSENDYKAASAALSLSSPTITTGESKNVNTAYDHSHAVLVTANNVNPLYDARVVSTLQYYTMSQMNTSDTETIDKMRNYVNRNLKHIFEMMKTTIEKHKYAAALFHLRVHCQRLVKNNELEHMFIGTFTHRVKLIAYYNRWMVYDNITQSDNSSDGNKLFTLCVSFRLMTQDEVERSKTEANPYE